MNETLKNMFNKGKDLLLMVLGHALTGAGTAAIYELTQMISKGQTDAKTLLTGALIGGSLGFLRTIIEEIETLKLGQSTPVVTGANIVEPGKKKVLVVKVEEEVKKEVKPVKKYFGF